MEENSIYEIIANWLHNSKECQQNNNKTLPKIGLQRLLQRVLMNLLSRTHKKLEISMEYLQMLDNQSPPL